MVVRDDDLRPRDVLEHVGGNKLRLDVVVVGVVGLKHPQAVLDRDARGDNEKAACELLALRSPDGVDGLPGDQHRHQGRLAGACGELQRRTRELGVRVAVRGGEVVEDSLRALAGVGSDLGEPDGRLHASTWQKNGRRLLNR